MSTRFAAVALAMAVMAAPAMAQGPDKSADKDNGKPVVVEVADAKGSDTPDRGPSAKPKSGPTGSKTVSTGTASPKKDMKKAAAEPPKPEPFTQRITRGEDQPENTINNLTGTVTRGEGWSIYDLADPMNERVQLLGIMELQSEVSGMFEREGELPSPTDATVPIIAVNYTYESAPGVRSPNSNLQTRTLEALTRDLAERSERPLVLINAPALRKGADGQLVSLFHTPLIHALANNNSLGPRGTHRDVGSSTIATYARILGADGTTEQGFAWGVICNQGQRP